MQFSSQNSADGVRERLFKLGDVPGVLWSPADAAGSRPIVLLSHGGGQHKLAPGVVARARRYVLDCGYAAAAIDAPGHGERPRSTAEEQSAAEFRARRAAGEPVGELIAQRNTEVAAQAVPEWQATLDALQVAGVANESVGWWGLSLGTAIGVPLILAEPRIKAAVLGLLGDDTLADAAAGIGVPVEFLVQWDDELVPRDAALRVFTALGSAEKTLHANPGRHAGVPRFEIESSVRFFARHLGPAVAAAGSFPADDGTPIAYHRQGSVGAPLVCVPGGMQASAYLGNLGGPSNRRVLVDLRGTGDSATPSDKTSYRCDRQVADLEALRKHLGVERLQLLGHSGGANLVYQYAAAHPHRVAKLVLVTPSPRGVGIDVPPRARATMLELRRHEPWYPEVAAAFNAIQQGHATDADWLALAPMTYGRWDATAQAHAEAGSRRTNDEAFHIYNDGFHPEPTRAALRNLTAPVLVIAGALDWSTPPATAEEITALFPNARLVVLPGAGHLPWMDTPRDFARAVDEILQ